MPPSRRFLGALTSGRNLRRRIAIAVGALTTLSVLGFGVATLAVVTVSLRSAIDDDLRTTADLLEIAGPANLATELGPAVSGFDRFLPGEDRPPVPFVQVVGQDGSQVGSSLPVTERALALTRGEGTGEAFFESVEDGGRDLRKQVGYNSV